MQQLSVEERKILEGRYIEGYRFITRDEDTDLAVYFTKPEKDKDKGLWRSTGSYYTYDMMLKNSKEHFNFIKWEDNEPYEIEKLLDIKDDSI